ncbi:hypothetical protein SAMN06265375_101415 [Muriicola jejuensis]|nr:hypothetical protein SAMN06265375_101415 [Muriicola jejuensis]
MEAEAWQLYSIYSYMTQTEQEASELNYTERIEFDSDGLFLKSQTRGGETTVVEGRWTAAEQDGRTGFLVTYDEDNAFIRNCFAEPQEFFFRAQEFLIQSDFIPCDGPEYRYVRVSE